MYVLFIDDVDMIYSCELVDCFDCLLRYQAKHKVGKFEIINDSDNTLVMMG